MRFSGEEVSRSLLRLTAGLTLRTNRRTITTTRLVAISLGRPMNYPGRPRPTHRPTHAAAPRAVVCWPAAALLCGKEVGKYSWSVCISVARERRGSPTSVIVDCWPRVYRVTSPVTTPARSYRAVAWVIT